MIELTKCPLIDVAELTIKPRRARKQFDRGKLDELKQSIKEHGIIQPLVLMRETIDNSEKIVVLAGERRYRASLELAFEDPKFRLVPYIWREQLSLIDQKKIELDENLRRDNLTDWEKNELYTQIADLESAARGTTRGDPNAFKLSELAAKTGEDVGKIGQRISHHRLMTSRPDIATQVGNKPLFTAIKEAKRILESEAAAAAVKIGSIVVRHDYRLGDNRELIKTLADHSVDAILSDFPFAIPDLADSQSDAQLYTGLMKHSDNLTTKEVDALVRELSPHLYRVLKPGGYMSIFFGWDCKYFMEYYFRSVGFEVDVEPLIWDKQSTSASFKGYSPAPCYEQIMWCVKPPRTRRLSEPMKKILYHSPVKKDIRTHVFEKPVALLSEIIRRVTNVGDVVFDPCAGTASVLRAAIELKRTGIGFEIDQQHYALGCKEIFDLEQRLQGVKA